MKKIYALTLLLAFLMLPSQILAANLPKVYYDGNLLQNIQTNGDYTYIPLRDICTIIDWQEKTQTISAQHPSGAILTLQVGKKTATLEQNGEKQSLTLTTAPYKSNGTTYVPLRFAGEALGYTVYWDKATQITIIYQRNAQSEAALQSADLATARNAAIKLPHINLMETLKSNQENISSITYIFPYGESKRFAEKISDILKYYEVRDGAAWLVWQGEIGTDDKIMEEQGERPDFGNKQVYFNDYFQADSITYGTIENNKMQQIEEIKNISSQSPDGDWKNRVIVHSIQGETKID